MSPISRRHPAQRRPASASAGTRRPRPSPEQRAAVARKAAQQRSPPARQAAPPKAALPASPPSRDVSFLLDAGSSGSRKRNGSHPFVKFPVGFEETRVPDRFHVVESSATAPAGKDGGDGRWTQLVDGRWVRHLFPAFHPTGRQQALLLGDALAAMLEEHEQLAPLMTPHEAVVGAHNVFSIAFHELVRQVSVSCMDRGALLKAVWW